MKQFTEDDLKNLWKPNSNSSGEDNGQVVIVGGSELFQGAPLLSMTAASRLVDMVFLATPDTDKETAEKAVIFSKLKSVIWIPKQDLELYIKKSDAILIGPGMMRFGPEDKRGREFIDGVYDEAGTETRMITQYLLTQFPEKRWVVDGGSLQVIEPKWLPRGCVITPNGKEYEMLFGEQFTSENLKSNAKKYSIIICYKGPITYVSDGNITYEIHGGNAGLTKGGTGDTLAGLTVGLMAKNEPLLAACAANFIIKKTADVLYEKVGFYFNADDVAEKTFETFNLFI